jgi:hypothetical protein
VDLRVEVEPFSPGGRSSLTVFLGSDDDEELSPALMRSLVDSAFGHLKPWTYRR